MAFQFPIGKLDLINSALALTGDNLVVAEDNGQDEWNVASPAYERALAYIMESHGWGFATLVITLQPSNTAPTDTDWDTQYPLPPDLVHLIWAKVNQDISDPTSSTTNQLTLYSIMGTPTGPVLVINAQGGPPPPINPVTPAQVTIKYISNAGALCDATNGTPTLILALQSLTMAGIYRGLQQDGAEGDKMWSAGMQLLQQARTRYDQQKPKRLMWNSHIAGARRVRRPWPAVGTGQWGSGSGNGVPG